MKQWNTIFLGFIGVFLLLLSGASAEDYSGLIVREVQLSCVSDREMDKELRQKIRIQVGAPFSQNAIRDSIRSIYALGHFSQITVEAEPLDGGVRLSFCPERFKILSSIRIQGNKSISSEEIRDVIGFEAGDPFPHHDLSDIRRKLLKLYRDEGYHQIQLTLQSRLVPDAPEQRILAIAVQEGRPSKIGTIAFIGQNAFSEKELLKASQLKRGQHFTLDNLGEAEDRLTRYYAEHGYFAMKVSNRDIAYHYESGETNLTLMIVEGKAVEVRIEGNARLKTKELRRQVDLFTPAGIKKDVLEENTQRVLEYYRSKGYHFARVLSEYTVEDGVPLVTVSITEGPQVLIDSLTIEGNHSFDDKAITREMLTKHRRRLFSKNLYREELLDEDLLAIKALYQAHGFLAVTISSRLEFLREQSRIAIRLTIDEGVQTLIETIDLSGEENREVMQELRKQLAFREGDPLNVGELSKGEDSIREWYINQGHLNAELDMTTQFTPDRSGAYITYTIEPGKQFYIGNIEIRGLERIRESFVTREILIKEGDVYNPAQIRETTSRLLRTGLYDSIIFRRLHPRSKETIQDMLLEVREASVKRVRFGLGYSTIDEFKAWVEYADKNVLNLGGRGSARLQLSTTRPKLTLQYQQPHVFLRDHSVFAILFDEIQKDNSSYEFESRGGNVGLKYDFSKSFSASAGYFFEYDEPSEVEEDAVLSPRDTSPLNLAGPFTQLRWDSRDDVLLPTTGSSAFLAAGAALDSFGSAAEYFQVQAQSKWFFPVFQKLVFAFALTGQAIDPIDHAEPVPIYKRYFLGGDISQNGSVRGFKKHEIGPSGEEGSKIGGDRLYAFNTELRFPLYRAFGGVVFYDTGANWLVDEGYEARDRREAIGAGLRLKTPIGPLRLDYGWKLDRRDGESAGEFIFSIGAAF